jgi:hypothetical protein
MQFKAGPGYHSYIDFRVSILVVELIAFPTQFDDIYPAA